MPRPTHDGKTWTQRPDLSLTSKLNAATMNDVEDRIDADVEALADYVEEAPTSLLLTPTSSARNTIQPSAADKVPLTIKGFAGQTADLQLWTDSADHPLFGVHPNGHGVFIDRPAGAPGDYASELVFRLAGTAKWSLGLSIEHQDFFIYNQTTANDVFVINAFDQVGIGAGTVTSTTDQGTRVFINADGAGKALTLNAGSSARALEMTRTSDDGNYYFGARIAGEAQSRFLLLSDGQMKWGPGGSTGANMSLSYSFSGSVPQLSLQPDIDGNAFSVLNHSAGSAVLRVDTSANVVRVKNLLLTLTTGASIDMSADGSAAQSIIAGTTNGLKIGTAAGQKIALFNATPIVQRSAYTNSSGLTAARTLPASYTMDDLAKVVVALMTDSHDFGFSA